MSRATEALELCFNQLRDDSAVIREEVCTLFFAVQKLAALVHSDRRDEAQAIATAAEAPFSAIITSCGFMGEVANEAREALEAGSTENAAVETQEALDQAAEE